MLQVEHEKEEVGQQTLKVRIGGGDPVNFRSFKIQENTEFTPENQTGFLNTDIPNPVLEAASESLIDLPFKFEADTARSRGAVHDADAIIFPYTDPSSNGGTRFNLNIRFANPNGLFFANSQMTYLNDTPHGRVVKLAPRTPLEIAGRPISVISVTLPPKAS